MKAFTMQKSPKIVFGENEAQNLAKHLREFNSKKPLISCDKGVLNSGLAEPIFQSLKDNGLEYVVFTDIEPETPDYVVEKLRDFIKSNDADCVVAIGGGSTIDTTRTAVVLSKTEGSIEQFFIDPIVTEVVTIPYVCIPTTAGTGAEMSMGGPVYWTKKKIKKGISKSPKATDLVILDPVLTTSLPEFVTYTTAMDALSHSLEAMTGKLRNAMTDMICGQAIEYVWRSLPKAIVDPKDLDARGELMLASDLAIGCQNLRHLGHAVCQPIGGQLHLAHGYSCALVLPGWIKVLADTPELKDEWDRIAWRLHIDGKDDPAMAIAAAIADNNKKYGIKTLKEAGYSYEAAIACTEEILKDGRLLPNCVIEVNADVIKEVIDIMYYGL